VSYILKTFLEALVGVVLGLLLVFSLGGGSTMCGRLGVSGSVLPVVCCNRLMSML
jgi:hypothetical protein